MIGRTLSHYRILDKLGEGGMGVVYLAEDTRLQRKVALKFVPPEMAHDRELLRRFEREAKAVAALNHPNIVTLYSVEEADGLRFLTMEHVEGKTLEQMIPAGGLDTRELLKLAVPMAEALAAAHARGITHRDFKPGNIMVTPEGRVKVLDFGLAKLLHSDVDATQLHGLPRDTLTREGRIIGTLAYMAPEQLQGRVPDARVDVFALGVVLYEMATGVCPFHGSNPADLISAVLRDQPAAMRRLKPDLLPGLNEIVLRCLQKAPEARFQSAAEARDALASAVQRLTTEEVLRGRGFSVPLPGSRASRWIGAAVALVLLAAVVGAWYRRGWPANHGPEEPDAATRAAPILVQPALVVLPLASFSGEPEYFVDGMTDGLISSLAKIKALRVISRQSAMHYKGSRKRVPEIASDLGVDYVVEGSAERNGDRVSLRAQLIRPQPEATLWSDTLERAFAETSALHNEAAMAIALAAGIVLSPAEETRMAATGRVDPEAYQAYLQGRFYGNRFNKEAREEARHFYEQAIAKDPSYAPAHAGLADTLIWLVAFDRSSSALLPRARAAAQQAIALDESIAEGHAALGEMALDRWQWAEAEREFRRAVDLDPSSATARSKYWMLLACQRRFADARTQVERAVKLNPVSAPIRAQLGMEYTFEKRYDEAIRELNQALSIDPSYDFVHTGLWFVYHAQQKDPERGRELREYLSTFGHPELVPRYDRVLAAEGYEAALSWVALELDRSPATDIGEVGVVAGLLALAGEEERALDWLRRGFEHNAWELGWLAVSPDYEPLYDQPAFRELLRAIGVPQPPT